MCTHGGSIAVPVSYRRFMNAYFFTHSGNVLQTLTLRAPGITCEA